MKEAEIADKLDMLAELTRLRDDSVTDIDVEIEKLQNERRALIATHKQQIRSLRAEIKQAVKTTQTSLYGKTLVALYDKYLGPAVTIIHRPGQTDSPEEDGHVTA